MTMSKELHLAQTRKGRIVLHVISKSSLKFKFKGIMRELKGI